MIIALKKHIKIDIKKNIKKNINTKIYLLATALLVSLISQQAYAVALSAYRIKLDTANPETEFLVFNKSVIAQQCSIKLTDIIYDKKGDKILHKGSGLPDISAKKHLKYSPKSFVLKGKNSQSIRFKYRRKRTNTPQEFRSYLSLLCDNIIDESSSELQINVTPRLRINIPIIVRTGDIPVEVKFSKMSYLKDKLSIEVTKSGARSIYGNLEVLNKSTGKVIHLQKGFSLHAEVTTNTHEFMLKKLDLDNIDIQFVEDKQLSGELSIRKSFQ